MSIQELKAFNEQLQALNEKLIAANHELKARVEETLKINDYLNNFISSADIATVFVDRAMRIMWYTTKAAGIFSIIPTDVGRPLLEISHRLDYDALLQDAGRAVHSQRVHDREVRSVDGRWFIARMIPYRTTEDRMIEGVVLTFIDISRLRGGEDRVRKDEERMRRVVESTLDYAILTTDLDGVVTNWNKGAERIFGYTESEMLGRSGEVLFTPEDRERGVIQEEMRRARQDGRAEDERWHVRKNGTTFYFSGITNPLNEGGLHGYAKIGRDITDSKRSELQREAQLREEKALRDAAQVANASKDEFLAIMSHELKHPLNLIHVNAELLSRIPEVRGQPAAIRAADTIRKTVLSQAQIINDLLDLSRSSTGKLALKPEAVDWAHVLDGIVATASADAERRRLELNCTVPTQPVYILADPVRLEQIIWNLLSNAIKFTPDGGAVDVVMSIENECARVDITDSGIGIEPDFLEHVFDMFRQASPATTRNTGGLGIGLALVRQLVELHGGKVAVVSEGLGYGACFSVWLPLDGNSRKRVALVDEPARGTGLDGLRILLVDDSEDTIRAFSELLEQAGALVTIASGGLQALKRLESGQFDLLLSDIAMPDFDGYMLIKKARQLTHCADMLAIAVTGFGRLDDSRKALQAGFDAHIGKPASMGALTGTIERLLKMSPLRGRGSQ